MFVSDASKKPVGSLPHTGTESTSEPQSKKEPESASSSGVIKKIVKVPAVAGTETLRWSGYAASLLLLLGGTIGGHLVLDSTLKETGVLPKEFSAEINYKSTYKFNKTFENFPGFYPVIETMLNAGLSPNDFVTEDKISLGSDETTQRLKAALQQSQSIDRKEKETAIKHIEDFEKIHTYTWGKNGPDPEKLSRNPRLNMMMRVFIEGLVSQNGITTDSIQQLKQMVHIMDYDFDKKNPYINYAVVIGDQYIPVKLNIPPDIEQRDLSENPLGIDVANEAFEKGMNGDCKALPEGISPSKLNPRFEENYLITSPLVLSDSELENILSQKKTIPVAKGEAAAILLELAKNKAGNNDENVEKLMVKKLFSHLYIVTNYNAEEKKVTVIGSDKKEQILSLSEFKREFAFIATSRDKVSWANLNSLPVFVLSLLLLFGSYKGANKVRRCFNPGYKSTSQWISRKLRDKCADILYRKKFKL